ncbi:YiiX/YebB-like N1pC/P60 family cysteine hydrolase [Bdellovibrio bacteriovorus]|uniref:YiiX/YebB-like N1pC/P60 family cysteine hydrolase n=1 Tax=Bdellovibrio bacteriovorus TaxID=959 RepID=UPI0035A5B7B8
MKRYLLGGLSVLLFSACQSPLFKSEETSYRKPASTEELITGSQKVLSDLSNPQIFNARTCASFVNKVTDYLYYLPADHFIPKTPQEVEKLKTHGDDVMNTIFQIRVVLHEKLQEFDSRNELTKECTQEVREGFQYARFAEEYLLEWLYSQKVYTFKKTPIMESSKPSTWTNPKYAGFQLKTGDVMLIRGKSYVSAMIARIGDEEGNFSHLAIVGEDKKGRKYVVEALIQYGVIVTPLEKWRQAEDARVALYRQPDEVLAKQAGRKIWEKAQYALDRNKGIRYDFAMDDDDYSTIFCSEVIRYAYDMASGGKFMVPKFRSSVSKFKNTDYPKSLGVTKSTLFAPYDIEVDPRFDFIAEYRFYPLLRQVRMQDAVLQSIYSWMIDKDYTFHWAPQHSIKGYFAKFVRQFGIAADTLPKYMPIDSIQTNVKFEAVAKVLEKNIYKKEDEFYKKKGYLPSFQDMLAMNEEFRRTDCLENQAFRRESNAPFHDDDRRNNVDTSRFHWFFYNDKRSCN